MVTKSQSVFSISSEKETWSGAVLSTIRSFVHITTSQNLIAILGLLVSTSCKPEIVLTVQLKFGVFEKYT